MCLKRGVGVDLEVLFEEQVLARVLTAISDLKMMMNGVYLPRQLFNTVISCQMKTRSYLLIILLMQIRKSNLKIC